MRWHTLIALACLTLTFCGDGSGSDGPTTTAATPTARTSTPRPSTEATATPISEIVTPRADAATPAGGSDASAAGHGAVPPAAAPTGAPASQGAAPPPPPPAPVGRVYTLSDAQAIVNAALISPADVGGGWTIASDTVSDNAAAAAADPRGGASFARCGRLLGRTTLLQPPQDAIARLYLEGETVSFFTLTTVYATDAGAIDCGTEAALRLTEPGELARAFGNVFVNPDAVVVSQVAYPQIGDGSFAATASGKTIAGGFEVDLTVLVVGFRKGNVGAVVGSASAAAPSTTELAPHVDRVLARIANLQ